MRIESLAGALRGAVATVVGTGPSLRVFPLDFLRDAPTIGLNQAWKHLRCRWSITVHPELLDEYESAAKAKSFDRPTQWLTKKKPPRETLEFDDPNYFVFHTSPDLKTVAERPADTLYIGEGVQCTAMDLVARMGARTIFLIGCDATSLNNEFHAHDQHVRWLGRKPEDQFLLYRKRTAQVRRVLRDSFGVNVLTLSPFIGVGHAAEDYGRLCKERGLPALPKPKDISPYKLPLPKN